MRLLLLLSAILSALTGVAGSRAVAQPVAASAIVADRAAVTRARSVLIVAPNALARTFGGTELRRLALAALVFRSSVPLFADRRRE